MALSRDEEVALVRRALAGDESAEERLVTGHLGLVKTLARRHRGRGVDDDDLVQIGLLEVLLTIRRFEPERGLRISTLATIRCLKAMRAAVAKAERAWSGRVSLDRLGGHPARPAADLDSAMLLDEVAAAIGELTIAEREVLDRHFGSGAWTYRRIGLAMGRSKPAVGRLKRKAVSKLRLRLVA